MPRHSCCRCSGRYSLGGSSDAACDYRYCSNWLSVVRAGVRCGRGRLHYAVSQSASDGRHRPARRHCQRRLPDGRGGRYVVTGSARLRARPGRVCRQHHVRHTAVGRHAGVHTSHTRACLYCGITSLTYFYTRLTALCPGLPG